MAPSVEKKLVELEMGLLHLQQNVDIPEIQLMPHPSVQELFYRLKVLGLYIVVDKAYYQTICSTSSEHALNRVDGLVFRIWVRRSKIQLT